MLQVIGSITLWTFHPTKLEHDVENSIEKIANGE